DCAPQSCLAIRWTNGTTTTLPASGSTTKLTAAIPASLVASAGTASIAVVALGGASQAVPFEIKSPAVQITGLSPASTAAGGSAFTLTVNGTGFLNCPPNTCPVIQWNSGGITTPLPTSGTATQLTAVVPANLIAYPGSASITVAALGGTSAP